MSTPPPTRYDFYGLTSEYVVLLAIPFSSFALAPLQMPALSAKDYLLIVLAGFTVFYIVRLIAGVRIERSDPAPGESTKPNAGGLLIGFVTNFFDTFGIGSFATTTAMWRQFKIVRDDLIPRHAQCRAHDSRRSCRRSSTRPSWPSARAR